MRLLAVLGAIGGAVGAVVAVLTHFLARRPPQGFFAYAPLAEKFPLHHPSWWPMLPASVGCGVAVGILLGALLHAAGLTLRVARRSQ